MIGSEDDKENLSAQNPPPVARARLPRAHGHRRRPHKREQAAPQIDRDPFSAAARRREDAYRERQPVQAPINIDQLTEQVARQLDRRIQAYRERTGKV